MPQVELTWYGPIRDLPSLIPPGPASKPSPPGEPDKPVPRRGADAYHPRQTILSSPPRPTHPRQTLIQPEAPMEPPKILPQLPNVVQWADAAKPTRPRLQISQAVLAKLRPKKPALRPLAEMPVPEVPNLEKQPGELNLAASASPVLKPQMPVAATSVPRVGPRQAGEDAAAAPDLRPTLAGGDPGLQRLIALSATPGENVANLPLPAGNLEARLSISPEGTQPGTPGGSLNGTPGATGTAGGGPGSPGGTGGGGGSTQSGSGGGGNSPGPSGVSISGGSPNSNVSGSGGPGGPSGGGAGSGGALPARPAPRPASPSPSRNAPVPGFDRLKPGAPPEEVFGPKRIYTLHVNMPNLASVTGSWILSFVEMPRDEDQGRPALLATDLTGPVPLRKVDPKYPPALISAKVEGEVILYAIIRRDGTVDSIQLVHGLEPELDLNAMQALARWRFRPAERQGAPVELETIVHIPFRAVAPLF